MLDALAGDVRNRISAVSATAGGAIQEAHAATP
jgi:hypothetical protein